MLSRPLIATLLWLTYALLLGHDVLPHHHHEGTIAHQGGPHQGVPDVDHSDAGQPDEGHPDADHHDEGEDEPDWWFAHQHAPGATALRVDNPLTQVMPVVAIMTGQSQVPHPLTVFWPGQTVGWPPAQAKAPPGQYRYRPLRAPPISSCIA